MRNYLLAISLLLYLFSATGYQAVAQVIPWNETTRLVWDDFQGKPDNTSNFDAYTRYNLSYKSKWDKDGNITITVECVFEKNNSWKKPGPNLTPKLLLHEQMHFNVAEIYARKMRQAFKGYTSTHKHGANTNNELNDIFHKLLNDCFASNDLYDAETNHSKIDAKQQEWNNRIATQLYHLADYKVN